MAHFAALIVKISTVFTWGVKYDSLWLLHLADIERSQERERSMKKVSLITVSVFLAAMAFMLSAPREAKAIKAYATRTGLDCTVCHNGPVGKLTPFGVDFLRRGHRLSEEEVTTDIAKMISINAKLRFNDSNAPGRTSSFEAHALALYFGTPLSKHFSTAGEIYLYENTGKTTGAVNGDFGRSKLADLYIQYTSNPKSDTFTTVRFGQLSPSQLNIYWNAGPRYTETRPYIVNNAAVSPNGYKPFMRNFGVEVAQTVKRFHGAFGVLNGTGAGVTNSVDNNRAKDYYATADYAIGGDGSAVGAYAYKGQGLITPATGPGWQNSFSRVGAFGQFTRGKINLTGVVTKGKEQIASNGLRTNNFGGLVEVDYNFTPKFAAFGRYDYFDPDQGKKNDQLSGPVFGAAYRYIDSGRIVYEFHKQGKFVTGKPQYNEHRVELTFMF